MCSIVKLYVRKGWTRNDAARMRCGKCAGCKGD